MRAAWLLLVVLLLPGCATPAATRAAPGSAPGAPVFAAAVTAFQGCARGFDCFEPSVAVDAAGRIFATDGLGSKLAISDDGGASFRAVATPPLPSPTTQGNDVVLQPSPEGRVYWSALAQVDDPRLPFTPAIVAVQVAWTDDGGRSWAGDTILTPPEGGLLPAEDRQWLAFGPNGTVYVSYNSLPTGLWVARSDDGGRTFGSFVRAVGLEQGALGQAGVTSVDRDGRLVVPYEVDGHTESRIEVAISSDRGATFQRHVVLTTQGTDGGDFFAMSLAAPDGTLVACWTALDGAVRVATSRDHGASWGAPATWSDTGVSGAPWPLARGDELVVAWLRGDATSLHLEVGRAPLATAAQPTVVARNESYRNQQGARGNGDFASIAAGQGALFAAVSAPTSVDVVALRG